MIIGMKIMDTNGFQLDLMRGVLQANEEEEILHRQQEDAVEVVISE